MIGRLPYAEAVKFWSSCHCQTKGVWQVAAHGTRLSHPAKPPEMTQTREMLIGNSCTSIIPESMAPYVACTRRFRLMSSPFWQYDQYVQEIMYVDHHNCHVMQTSLVGSHAVVASQPASVAIFLPDLICRISAHYAHNHME